MQCCCNSLVLRAEREAAGKGLRRNPIWTNLLPRGRRGQGRVKVRAHVLPAPSPDGARGCGEGRESRKYRSGADVAAGEHSPSSAVLTADASPFTPRRESPGTCRGSMAPAADTLALDQAHCAGRETWRCGGCLARVAVCQWCLRGPSSSRRVSSWLLCWEQAEVHNSLRNDP